MLRKISTLFVVLIMLAFTLNAQDRVVLRPSGEQLPIKGKNLQEAIKGAKLINTSGVEAKNIIVHGNNIVSTKGTLDTMDIREITGGTFGTAFSTYDQDVMVQWYVAPTQLVVKAVGFTMNDTYTSADPATQKVLVSIVKVGITEAEIIAGAGAGAPAYWGYWPSDDGFLGGSAFEWFGNGNAWVTDAVDPLPNPFTENLWSDPFSGAGVPVSPVTSPNAEPVYNWVEMNADGWGEPTIEGGEIFGIAIVNNGLDQAQPDEHDYAFMAQGSQLSHPGFKYYAVGRSQHEHPAWWSRKYTWDFVAAVELLGDTPPNISDVTALSTTLSTDPQTVEATVTDINPGGGDAGVASATLMYSVGGDYMGVAMSASGDVYTADIPGQAPGTFIDYYVAAEDVLGNTSESQVLSYNIFAAENTTLVVFNGFAGAAGYPQSYYFGVDDFTNYTTYPFTMDYWAYGELTEELVNNYTNIIEIATDGPTAINSGVIAAWLAADGTRNYMLAGDEWMGAQSGWADGPWAAGSFHFDVLGVNYEYNDLVASSADASLMEAVQGTLLGGPLYDLWMTNGGTDSLMYDPNYEIGVTNWLDGADFEADVEVDMLGYAPDGTAYNALGHRTLTAGNKVAFYTYDPISLNSTPNYYWYGFSESAPQVQTALWFGVETGVEPISNEIPSKFELSQNYPNPFNPATTINFALTVDSKVEVTVYNLLGQVVANEVYNNLTAGTHKYTFDGANLTSGVYFYNVNVEGVDGSKFSSTKKMMLLK